MTRSVQFTNARLLPAILIAVAAAALAAMVPDPARADDAARSKAPSACNDQRPLPFLVRSNYSWHGELALEVRRARAALHRKAIRYRTERYGHVKGFGHPSWNPSPAVAYTENITFMGLPIGVHKRIVPALRCVEAEIKATCKVPYRPHYLSGFRGGNTFYNGEVSNHRYGIAVDVDPERNICCKCLGAGALHPICKQRGATLADRMVMPLCWVAAFERFGFFWLGRDELEDTMHFEFLAEPEKILRAE